MAKGLSSSLKNLQKASASALSASRALPRLVDKALHVLIVATLIPIIFTPYGGDDLFNHNIWPGVEDPYSVAFQATVAWIEAQGRFFPTAAALGTFVFTSFTTRLLYKLFLFATALACIYLLRHLISLIVQNRNIANLSSLIFISTISVRLVNDPWSQYASIVPFSLCLSITSIIFSLQAKKKSKSTILIGAVICINLAGTTYELSYLFLPLLLMVILISHFKPLIKVIYLFLASLSFVISVSLAISRRLQTTPVAGKYSYSIDFWNSEVYLIQLSDVIPPPIRIALSALSNGPVLQFAAYVCLTFLIGLIAYFLICKKSGYVPPTKFDAQLVYSAIAGATLVFCPPSLLAISQEWTSTAIGKTPYLFGPFMSAGLALLFSVIASQVHQVEGDFKPTSRIFENFIAMTLVLVVAGNALLNFSLVEQLVPGVRFVESIENCRNIPWSC